MHEIVQLNGQASRVISPAQIQIITEPWDMGAVYYPYMVYIPEKDRLVLLLLWGQQTRTGISISDDGGATWSRPRSVGDGSGIGLSDLSGGNLVLKLADQYRFSHDCGETWANAIAAPDTEDGKTFDEDSPFLVDRDAESGRVTRLWGTGKKPGLACLYRCSEDAGRTWGPCRHVPQWGCTGEIVLHRAGNGNIIAACRMMLPQFEGKIDHHSGLGISVSEDNGQTWSELDVLYAWGRHMSSMVTLANGDIVLTYVARMGYVDTDDGYPQFGIEAVISRDHGWTWDLDHRYLLAVWKGNRKGRDGWLASPQRTATVLLPDGSLLTAFGTGYRNRGMEGKRTHSPQDIGLVRWRINDAALCPDTTIADAPVDSDLRNIFDPKIGNYALNDPGEAE